MTASMNAVRHGFVLRCSFQNRATSRNAVGESIGRTASPSVVMSDIAGAGLAASALVGTAMTGAFAGTF